MDPNGTPTPAARATRPPPGFTLVEVLVAMTVMAVMAVMAWQGVDGIVRARSASQARLEQTLRLDSVITQWEQDLASVQDPGRVPAITCDGGVLRLVRRTPEGLQMVAWSLQADDSGSAPGTSIWRRWAGPSVTTVGDLQDSWIHSQQLQGDPAGSVRALEGLTQWQVYYFREGDNTWTNCQSSGTVAGGANNPAAVLPVGVRLVLAFAPQSGLEGRLTRDVLLGP